MKSRFWLLMMCFCILMAGCEKKTTEPDSPTTTISRTIVTNPWKINRITETNGTVINMNSLPAESKALFGINIQFFEDKTVRALDPVSKSVINGGRWDLIDNDKTMDIDVSQLKGKYPIVELSKSKMVLRNKIPFGGVSFEVNLELVPAL
jgi:hypothetical protein